MAMKHKDYRGLTYNIKWKGCCAMGIHRLDEVCSPDVHYLHCDDCGLMIHIKSIDDKYVKTKIGRKDKQDGA